MFNKSMRKYHLKNNQEQLKYLHATEKAGKRRMAEMS